MYDKLHAVSSTGFSRRFSRGRQVAVETGPASPYHHRSVTDGNAVRATIRIVLLLSAASGWGACAQAQWRYAEQVKTYPIAGQSGIELYSSIGESGPKVGSHVRAIAHTDFKLTWSRNYVPQPDGSCTLQSARPNLTITFVLPKPVTNLPPELEKKWAVFIEGVRKHELVHAEQIKSMVAEIEKVSVGLSVPADPKCTKIRASLTEKLGEISRTRVKASQDFDRVELSEGGNVHQLILNLVNPR
jgi:predicted secreted Zn-dependent protease